MVSAHCIDVKVTQPNGKKTIKVAKKFEIEFQYEDGKVVTHVTKLSEKHPDFDPNTGYGDVGLLYLTEDLPSGFAPALIYSSSLYPGDKVEFSGFGSTNGGEVEEFQTSGGTFERYSGIASEKVEVELLDHEFIVVKGDNGSTTCHGDSGGPVFKRNSKGEYRVAGLLAGGSAKCGRPEDRSYFINVMNYFSFLKWTVKEWGEERKAAPKN